MTTLSPVEDTLYVPLLGRLYATKNFPDTFYDSKVLEIEKTLSDQIAKQPKQKQYTLIASATRSLNMDRAIQQFMKQNPDGVIVLLGSGLETTFFRNDNGQTIWYEIDLENVISLRKRILGSCARDNLVVADAFVDNWLIDIQKAHPYCPLLIIASGLFYYFPEKDVLHLLRSFKDHGPIDVVFDTVNSKGMKRMDDYMKQVGHQDAHMYFYVDEIHALAHSVGAEVVSEEPYYAHLPRKGLSLVTKASVCVSDAFTMVKMEHIAFK